MADRKLYLIAGLGFFLGFIIISLSYYSTYQVFVHGQIVEVTIKSLPRFNGTRHSLMYFDLDGEMHSMDVKYQDVTGLHIGHKVKIRYLDGYADFSTFPDDNPLIEATIVMLFILSLSVGCLYVYFRKRNT